MPIQVVNGAQTACTFGAAPGTLTVLPVGRSQSSHQFEATIQDFIPMVNIMPFGMCLSPSNPQVAAATAAAFGVLTPQPCIPMTQSPWTPGVPNVMLSNQPVLDNLSTCACIWGGIVSILNPGQTTAQTP